LDRLDRNLSSFECTTNLILFSGTLLLRRMDLKIRIFLLNVIMLSRPMCVLIFLCMYEIHIYVAVYPRCYNVRCLKMFVSEKLDVLVLDVIIL
jgi:hypothetical protein